jgi:hypothetical protein
VVCVGLCPLSVSVSASVSVFVYVRVCGHSKLDFDYTTKLDLGIYDGSSYMPKSSFVV